MSDVEQSLTVNLNGAEDGISDFLSADDILSANDIKLVRVDVPEWGGAIYIRPITISQMEKIEQMLAPDQNKKRRKITYLRETMLVMSIVNPNTLAPIFTRKDMPKLAMKSAAATERVFDQCLKLSGFKQEDVDELVDDFIEGQTVD